jgi:hypothetical protein
MEKRYQPAARGARSSSNLLSQNVRHTFAIAAPVSALRALCKCSLLYRSGVSGAFPAQTLAFCSLRKIADRQQLIMAHTGETELMANDNTT